MHPTRKRASTLPLDLAQVSSQSRSRGRAGGSLRGIGLRDWAFLFLFLFLFRIGIRGMLSFSNPSAVM